MTASCRLLNKVNLSSLLVAEAPFCWRNRGFDAVSLRLFTDSGALTALVYSSGAVVFVGSKSFQQLEEARRCLCSKLGAACTQIKVHNICFSFMLKPLNLNRVFTAFREDSILTTRSYDPELFPALTLTMNDTKLKASLFHTGRINLIGCKTTEEAERLKTLLVSKLEFYCLI